MSTKFQTIGLSLSLLFSLFSCSSDDGASDNDGLNPIACNETENIVYEEKDGLITVEFESNPNLSDWQKETAINEFLGTHYIIWKGDQSLNNPGNGLLTYKIQINNPGTYRFLWRSRIAQGTSGTEHNDSWLRFADADDFYGQKDQSTVYPQGTGQTPNPNGASKDGWFKIYLNGTGSWKWQAKTSDNDPHQIFVVFDNPGIYTMEVSARSSYHALDRFTLFNTNVSVETATDDANEVSATLCD
ncbi:hypothetical protein [Aquimarina brevivitae]|uniref:Uncharacterized protein n=1 Tax=Aquimarina brevivitae TaxID=323412 RepID=A0A4Q7PHU2_9FLAO|nr:hypothetical protein [Aquimarina brevivitae]RZT00125.1 hypothetical protein EV197_1358 [Aquimarina brevivitae]